MRRRDFIALGGAAVAMRAAEVNAQQIERVRTVGVLLGGNEQSDLRGLLQAFAQSLKELGWIEKRNVRLDIHYAGVEPQERVRAARELVGLQPDVIFAAPSNAVIALQKETRTIPIVFANVSDPIAQGIVDNLARPSGNLTGFGNLEPSLMGKWLQILKEASPGLKRVGLMIGTVNAASPIWFRMFKEVAPTLAIEPLSLPIDDTKQILGVIKSIAEEPHSAIIVAGDTMLSSNPVRKAVILSVAAHRLPAMYGELHYVDDGGLMSYGVDHVEPFRRAASYVDRILKGEKPSDLPVQQPRSFHFAINLKTAKSLGLELSPTLVASADKVIE